jgi:hypothetical protein
MQKQIWFLSSFEHANFAINEKYSKFSRYELLFHAIYVFIVEVKTLMNVDYVTLNSLAFSIGI